MNKRNKIIYWIATAWLCLGLVSTGIVQIIQMPDEVANFSNLGYPSYLTIILGVWKILGVIAILIPRYPVVKEWAYAGVFFTMTGAIISHVVVGDAFSTIAPPLLLLVLTMVSWYFRPDCKKALQV